MKAKTGKKSAKILIFLILILTLLIQSAIMASPLIQVDNEIAISASEIADIENNFPINCNVVKDSKNSALVKFRLFDLFTFKTVKANIISDEEMYIGGNPIGIIIKADGVIITGRSDVVTNNGLKSPTKDADIAVGDVLLKLNNQPVNYLEDIRTFLKTNEDTRIDATIRRGSRIFLTPLFPAVDTLSNEKKLGLFIKEEISGIGTLTFIRADNMRYGALGHNVSDSMNNENAGKIKGDIYSCEVIGVEKGAKGAAGELKGLFSKNDPKGGIIKSNSYGIYGIADKSMIEGKEKIVISSRFSVKPGKAQIMTTIDGSTPKKYDIEIIKLNYQKEQSEKGMIIRITDKELLDKTGGIVQGMSGSPIIQDGKLIGAVTHVFLNDPTKGYGIYIDWMKDN